MLKLPVTYKVEISCGRMAYWDTNPDANPEHPTLIFLHGHITNKRFFVSQFHAYILRGSSKKNFDRFSGSFEPIFASFDGVNIKLRI